MILDDFVVKYDLEREDKFAILAISSQECSRKCLEWDIITEKKKLILPDEINYFLDNYSFLALCGGSVIDNIIGLKPNDYDFFFIEKGNFIEIQNFVDKLKIVFDCYETLNAISIIIEKGEIGMTSKKTDLRKKYKKFKFLEQNTYKIQFIKRIYNNISGILGGFDIDSSKFGYQNETVFCTNLAYFSLKLNKNYLNLNNQSKTFSKRIRKYNRKGFSVYNLYDINKNYRFKRKTLNEHEFEFEYYKIGYSNIFIDNEECEKRQNLSYLMKENYHKLFLHNKKITKEEFLNTLKNMSEKRKNGISATYFHPKGDNIKCDYGVFYYKKQKKIYKFKESENNHMFILQKDFLEERYKFYDKLSSFKTTNVFSQFTGSFYPTNYEKSIFCKNYKNVDFLEYYPEILCLLKNKIFPKYIRYKICKDYVNTLLKNLVWDIYHRTIKSRLCYSVFVANYFVG